VICNFDAHQTKQFSIEIPALAMGMMQRNQVNLTKKKYWIAPNIAGQAQVKGHQITIPANSVMILNLK